MLNAFSYAYNIWKTEDGVPIIDYNDQAEVGRIGKHAEHLYSENFIQFIKKTIEFDFDIMIEIKIKRKALLNA